VYEKAIADEVSAMADEESWPSWPVPRPGLTARELRQLEQERRISERLHRHRDQRGGGPRGRDRRLTRDDIVDAAIALADAEGVEAVSMRRLARDLRAGPMSLYWYVESKDDLLDLMLDRVQGDMSFPELSGDWRADLRSFARLSRAALKRHPWAIDLLGLRPPSGPNDAHNADLLFGIFLGLGVTPNTAVRLAMSFNTFLEGAVRNETLEIRGEREMADALSRMSEEDRETLYDEFFNRVSESGEYPSIARIMAAGIDPDDPATRDERFEFGLELILDGIAARLTHL
jgi:AcrR family transcriptional regulator